MLPMETIQQHVLIVGDGTLFDEGVTYLLTHGDNVRVTHATYSDDPLFLNSIQITQPDVILVSESGSLVAEHILSLISSHSIVMGLPIIIVRLSNNMIEVYDKPVFVAGRMSSKPQRISIGTWDDLLSVVRRTHKAQ